MNLRSASASGCRTRRRGRHDRSGASSRSRPPPPPSGRQHPALPARPPPDAPRLAERFELYACGVELANGFGELTDASEQRRRFSADMDLKEQLYGERYPLDEDFLAALDLMPPASGIALGFDRLVMLATGAPKIDDVIWVPVG